MFRRSLEESIHLVEAAFNKALEHERAGLHALAANWLDKAIRLEREALA